MRKEIWPRGYNLRYTNLIGSIVGYIVLFVFFLVSGVADNQKDFMEFSKFASIAIIILFLPACIDVYGLFKTYKRRKEREWIIKNAIYSAKGIVHGIEEELIDYKGNRVYEPPNVVYTDVNRGYRILVAFSDPEDGKERIVKSDLYMKFSTRFLKNSEIIVYIGKNTQPLVAIYKQK